MSGGLSEVHEDPAGVIVDQHGKHFAENVDPGVGSSGYMQVNVVAVHDDAVAVESRVFTELGPGRLIVGPGSGAVVPPGQAGDTWVDPEVLKKQAPIDLPAVKLYRDTYKIGDKPYRALYISVTTGSSWSYHVFDLESGMLLHVATATQGRAKLELTGDRIGSRTGDALLTQSTFVSLRQTHAPWADSPLPPALAATKGLAYEGVGTLENVRVRYQVRRPLRRQAAPPCRRLSRVHPDRRHPVRATA